MSSKHNIIEDFYRSFSELDAEGMKACYHSEVVFHDPAFGTLNGKEAMSMWEMLCESQKGKDFRVQYGNIEIVEDNGSAHWEAWYIFSKTNRKVHNVIAASFVLKDGLIIRHEDSFNLYRWSRQALGLQGTVMGWTSHFRSVLQKQTRGMLKKYMERNDG